MMFSIGSWNIRGLNDSLKQVEVKNLIRDNYLYIVGFIETHVQGVNKCRIMNDISLSWRFLNNDPSVSFGVIWVGWDPGSVQISQIHYSVEAPFLEVSSSSSMYFVFILVYGNNYYVDSVPLWRSIVDFAVVNTRPWIIVGDFNSSLYPYDEIGGAQMMPFHYIEIFQIVCIMLICLIRLFLVIFIVRLIISTMRIL